MNSDLFNVVARQKTVVAVVQLPAPLMLKSKLTMWLSPSVSDQAVVGTFIQLPPCSDIEDMTWKWSTSVCDLMFLHLRGFDAPC